MKELSKKEDILSLYEKHTNRHTSFIFIVLALSAFFVLVGVSLGSSHIPLSKVADVIIHKSSETASLIVWNIRLPRVLGAFICGCGIAVSGAAMQSLLRNPLGSPYTLGLSSAAAFGAAFAIIVLNAGSLQSSSSDAVIINNPYIVTLCSFAFCCVATFVIILLARIKGATPETMILAGIALGSLFSAASSALQYFADEVELASVVFWTFGDIGRISWSRLGIIAAVVIPVCIYFIYNSWNYQVMDAGDETAKSLGINVERCRMEGMLVASLAVATVVSFVGIIGFIGLVVPHLVRRINGGYEPGLIPSTILFGGLFLLISDIVARNIISPTVLPVGVLTSFLGAPLFIYLLLKGRGYW